MRICLAIIAVLITLFSCTTEVVQPFKYVENGERSFVVPDSNLVLSHQSRKEYNVVYAPKNALFYRNIKRINTDHEDSIFVQFTFDHSFKGHVRYVFQQDSGAWLHNQSGEFVFGFERAAERNIESSLIVGLEIDSIQREQRFLNVSFDPAAWEQANGRHTIHDGFYIHNTDMDYIPVRPTHYIEHRPTKEDVAWIKGAFHAEITDSMSVDEKALEIAQIVVMLVESGRGMPTTLMDTLPTIEQIKRVLQGGDEVWCSNIARIYAFICTCYDVPVRTIALGETLDRYKTPQIFFSDNHAMNEYFDSTSNQWKMVDLSFYLLHPQYKAHDINTIDFHHLFNNAQMRSLISVMEVDTTGAFQRKPVTETRDYWKLQDYYKKNQEFQFHYYGNRGHRFYYKVD